MDGVNLYSLQNTNYSIFLVVIIKSNIPPWLSVKNKHLILDLIVFGRRQLKNMDVYLQSLINKFKKLWEGVQVCNISSPISMDRSFTLYGICAYTTHDYLGLGVFSRKHVNWFTYIHYFINLIWHATLFYANVLCIQ